MRTDSRVFVTGHKGMVGAALTRRLQQLGFSNVITATREELDLRRQTDVESFFESHQPEVVIAAAAKVGGIKANIDAPAEFLFDNLMIEANLLNASAKYGTSQVVMIGSSCIYPRECPQPMKEEYLLTGPLEPTNEGYALAKIAGIRLAQYLAKEGKLLALCPIPCNLYGPQNSFDPEHSHVLAALVRRFAEAKHEGRGSVTLWGTGSARREFLHVEDLVSALLFLIDNYDSAEIINVGSGSDVSIRDLASLVARQVGYEGEIKWDRSMPDGMPRKLMDSSRIRALGWAPQITFEEGIAELVKGYESKLVAGRV